MAATKIYTKLRDVAETEKFGEHVSSILFALRNGSPIALMAFALLAIGFSGCLFSGIPCEPGDWHYHCDGCRSASPGQCESCARCRATEYLDDTGGCPERPMIQPRTERNPSTPSSSMGVTRQPRPARKRSSQVAQLQWNEPYRPQKSTSTRSRSAPAKNAAATGVQKCSWQETRGVPICCNG